MLKNSNCEPFTDSKEKNETREAFFGSLLNNPVNDSADINPRVSGDLARVNNSAPSSAEITLALNSLKTGNADGTDQLPSELFKFAADDLASPLLSLFGKIWTSTYILSDWKDAIIIPVHKKGDKALCSNYLGISLTNSVFKALEIVMRKRIEPAYSPLRARIRQASNAVLVAGGKLSTLDKFLSTETSCTASLFWRSSILKQPSTALTATAY